MFKDDLIDKIQSKTKVKPGTFREKDLAHLFQQCSQAYTFLLQLHDQKQKLQEYKSQIKIVPLAKAETEEKEKVKEPAIESVKKKGSEYKIKCEIKSCGKIMFSQASFNIHMKKHAEKKLKRQQILDMQ